MAKKAKPNDAGGNGVTNLTAAKAVIAEEVRNILARQEKIALLSAANTASRKRVKSYGVPLAALAYAIRIRQMDPEEREKHDEGCAIARDAIGLPMQRSLFEMLDERLDAEAKGATDKAAKNAPKPRLDNGPSGDDSDLAVTPAALDKACAHLSPVPDAVH